MTSIEYTVDLYCHDRESMQRLFRTMKRYLHIPYQRNANLYGGDIIEWGNAARMNAEYRAGDVTMYERGPDGKKKKRGRQLYWDQADCDRVRLERYAPRKLLKSHDISTVDDLIGGLKFHEINGEVYRFICFEGSKRLPRIWEDYLTSDENGNMNCLQLEIKNGRKNTRNLNQYMKHVSAFDPLSVSMQEAMKRLDDEWISH